MDEFFEIILRDYLGENWSSFTSFCEQRGVESNDVYVALGGEPE